MNRNILLLVTLISEGGLYFLGLVLMSSSKIELRSVFNISWTSTFYALLLTLPMVGVLYLMERMNWKPIVEFRDQLDEKVRPIFSECKIIDLGMIAFFAGVGEELFFRGWMQAVLVDRFGILAGILIVSIVFGFLHYLSPAYAVYAFFTSIYLGIIYLLTRNVFIVMAIHAIYDFVALVYLVRESKGGKTEASI